MCKEKAGLHRLAMVKAGFFYNLDGFIQVLTGAVLLKKNGSESADTFCQPTQESSRTSLLKGVVPYEETAWCASGAP